LGSKEKNWEVRKKLGCKKKLGSKEKNWEVKKIIGK
jgi:hypothetical protein